MCSRRFEAGSGAHEGQRHAPGVEQRGDDRAAYIGGDSPQRACDGAVCGGFLQCCPTAQSTADSLDP